MISLIGVEWWIDDPSVSWAGSIVTGVNFLRDVCVDV
jgi:hypothetical protein